MPIGDSCLYGSFSRPQHVVTTHHGSRCPERLESVDRALEARPASDTPPRSLDRPPRSRIAVGRRAYSRAPEGAPHPATTYGGVLNQPYKQELSTDSHYIDKVPVLSPIDSWSIPSLCMPPRRSQVDAYDVPVAHWVSSSSSTVIHTHCPAICHIANSSSSSLSSSLSTGSATVEA